MSKAGTNKRSEVKGEKPLIDIAMNERVKAESEINKLDPRPSTTPAKSEYYPTDSSKKTGGTKR